MDKNILFLCVENSCRSQMAQGFASFHGPSNVKAFSAGSKPGRQVNPLAVQVMQEKGINISNACPKGFEELPVNNFDYVVSMGCGDACPYVPAVRRIEWKIPDPKGKEAEYFRKIRDEIERKVIDFLKIIETEKANGKTL